MAAQQMVTVTVPMRRACHTHAVPAEQTYLADPLCLKTTNAAASAAAVVVADTSSAVDSAAAAAAAAAVAAAAAGVAAGHRNSAA